MQKAPGRLGLWFALTLALPCALAGAWLWLVPGGVVQRARADERQAAERSLAEVTDRYRSLIDTAVAAANIRLQLDGSRRVVAPFRALATSDADAAGTVREPHLAERAALQRLTDGSREEALAFFEHAEKQGRLSPEGWLAFANARSHPDCE